MCETKGFNNIESLTPMNIRYLDFRPYLDSIDIPPQTPKDQGYYFKIVSSDGRLIKCTLEDNGLVETNSNNWCLFWSSSAIKSNVYLKLKEYQKVNHFPRSAEITRKDLLYKNLARMQSMYKNMYNFVPISFLLPNEHPQLQEAMEKDPNLILIVKPVVSSQGRGIFLSNNIQEISNVNQPMIACQYIMNPYLINGYKFDIRIYVLVTSILPLRMYIYDEGLVRFATEKYFIGQPFKNNRFMHLLLLMILMK